MEQVNRLIPFLFLFASLATADEPQTFPRGAKPSPRYKLQSAAPHRVKVAAPAQFAIVPKQLSMWFNDTYGCCVTSQEAFAKAAWSVQCGLPELFIPDAEVKRWAGKYGYLNGANLTDVMDTMARDGFTVSGVNYKDGPYQGVDYSNETVLQSAIYTGPVNIAIDADALPSGAGNQSGWYATGTGRFPNTDHCVALSGYGPAEYLYKQLGLTTPTALAGKSGYLLFTWNTIGFVDHPWLMGTCVEAWVRNPTTPGQSPTPDPGPGPGPTPTPPGGVTITLSGDLPAGTYQIGGTTLDPKMTLEDLIKLIGKTRPAPAPTPKPVPPPMPKTKIWKQKTPAEQDAITLPTPKVGEEASANKWDKWLLPIGAEKFEPTRVTQSIYTTDGFTQDHIDRVSIASLERKWQISGGMEGIAGVVSEKYKSLPSPPKEEIGLITVANRLPSGSQQNYGLKRTYADGSRFDDVLSYAGRVFEHRFREKKDGKWQSKVLFTDEQARPPGYSGLTVTCASCHKQAGSGLYNSALIPGSDTVLSDELPWNLLTRR